MNRQILQKTVALRKENLKVLPSIAFFIFFLFLQNILVAQTPCDGVSQSKATLDNCGICTGGTTGLTACKDLTLGNYYIVSKHSGLCLQDATSVTQETISNQAAKLWEVTKVGSFYAVRNTGTNEYLSVAPESPSYVLSTFKGDNNAGMKLSIYNSTDALNFNLVSDTGFEGTSSNLRDPSIMRHMDGKYYVAYTTAPTESCCGNQNYFSIASSTDLVHWTDHVNIPAGIANARHVWAPEWYIEGNTVRIIVSIETGDWQFRAYLFTALTSSLTTWSAPAYMGIGPNYIDTYVIKEGSTYHAFTKNETTKYLEHATATSITGPWSFVATGNWSGWGSGVEGNCVVKLSDGSYRIFFDSQGTPYKYADSKDLNTWTAAKNVPGIYNIARHGTVINLTQQPPLSGAYLLTNPVGTRSLWRLEDGGNETYSLVPAANLMLTADIASASVSPGAKAMVYKRNGEDNQKFIFRNPLSTGTKNDHSSPPTMGNISPNPFTKELRIQVLYPTDYFIYNAEGKLMESGKCTGDFSVGHTLDRGFYTLRLANFSENKLFKVVKE